LEEENGEVAAKRSTAYAQLATGSPSSYLGPSRTESARAARSVREGESAGWGWRIRSNAYVNGGTNGVRLDRYV